MLQSYKIDAALLHEEYKSEFYSDMSKIESLLPVAEATPDQEEQEGELTESPANTIKIDPSAESQRWRKTEEGWEREDSPEDASSPDSLDTSTRPKSPSWAKKLYKRIALASHPDRTLEEENKKRLNKIFTDSAQAMSDGKFDELVGLALDLGISLDDIDIDHVPVLKSRIEKVKQELKDIESTLEWLWGESLGLDQIRVSIAYGYLSKKGLNLNIDDLPSIIREVEGKNEARSGS